MPLLPCSTDELPIGCEQWAGSIHEPSFGEVIVAAPNGTLVFAGGSVEQGGSFLGIATAYHAMTGRIAWRVQMGPPAYGAAISDGALDSNGSRLYLAGGSKAPDGGDEIVAIRALDVQDGRLVWSALHEGGRIVPPVRLALGTSTPLVYVAGGNQTTAYESMTGALAWVIEYPTPIPEVAPHVTDLALSTSGRILYSLVQGVTSTSTDTWSLIVFAHDATTGQLLWMTPYGGPEHVVGHACSMAVGAAAVFVGTVTGVDTLTVLAFDQDSGALRWAATHEATKALDGCEVPIVVAVSADSQTVYAGGTITAPSMLGPGRDTVLLALNASTGDTLWTASPHQLLWGERWIQDMVVEHGHIYTTGLLSDTTKGGYDTNAYAPNGELEWSAAYSIGPYFLGSAYPRSIDASAGRVFVTGGASDLFAGDYAMTTVSYLTSERILQS
jgi:outer membrane protein assembly factor BamB